jgi:hypothetical protein
VGLTIDDYRWLVSDAAGPWLALACEELVLGGCVLQNKTRSGDDLLKLASRLRKDLSAERTHLVIEQVELRHRARDKFSRASQMFFTRKGLEQATDEQLAAYKASRFPAEQPIADLCCGIGGDLLALAGRGPTRGIERDAVTALLATANAAACELSSDRCTVDVEDVTSVSVSGCAWHCDPDRRKEGRRTTRGELFDPSLEAIDRLLARSNLAAVKLAPATDAPVSWCQTAELQWLSTRGECRQQVAWFGPLARFPGQRAATVITTRGEQRTIVGTPDQPVMVAASIGRYIYEPDAAVLAAKLSSVLCRAHGLAALSPDVAYFTSDTEINDLAMDRFEVLDCLPFDRKQLRAYCREHQVGRLEIKKRGVDLSPDQLRKEIVAHGDNAATILVAPFDNQVRAIIARRPRD